MVKNEIRDIEKTLLNELEDILKPLNLNNDNNDVLKFRIYGNFIIDVNFDTMKIARIFIDENGKILLHSFSSEFFESRYYDNVNEIEKDRKFVNLSLDCIKLIFENKDRLSKIIRNNSNS